MATAPSRAFGGGAVSVLGDARVGIDDVVRVARGRDRVAIAEPARARIAAARAVVERYAKSDVPIYGLTTALGAGVDTRLDAADIAAFQVRAIRARSVGVGPRMPAD